MIGKTQRTPKRVGVRRRKRSNGIESNLPIQDATIYHGRRRERLLLKDLLEESRKNTMYVTIGGGGGIGKSSLVQSQNWNGERSPCMFASGKFEQKKTSIPFSAISDALLQLSFKWAATEYGEAEMEAFCESLTPECPLPNLVPSLYHSDGSEGRSCFSINNTKGFDRLKSNVWDMLKCIITDSQTVVLLLDDIHWADAESLRLVQYLLDRNLKGLLLVATYRSEMTYQSDILKEHLEEIHHSDKTRKRTKHIHLSALSLPEVNSLLSELTSCEEETNKESLIPISALVHEKTGGNPFFIKQFLQLLQREGLLKFEENQWEWADAEEIRNATKMISSDAIGIVLSFMERLEPKTREIVQVASCIGHQIPFEILQKYFKREKQNDESMCDRNLKTLLDKQVQNCILIQKDDASIYYWSHEKLREAAYSMMSEEESQRICVILGKLLLRMSFEASASRPKMSSTSQLRRSSTSRPKMSSTSQLRRSSLSLLDNIALQDNVLMYMAADQLNRVPMDLLVSEGRSMKVDVVSLNLQAAKISISKSAFHNAVGLLRCGARILKFVSSAWDDYYSTSLELFTILLETEYTIGNHDEAMVAISEVMYNALTLEDAFRAQVCHASIVGYGKDRDASSATDMYIEFLKKYGVLLPKNPGRIQLMKEERILRKALPNGKIENIFKLPIMRDKKAINITTFLTQLTFHSCVVPKRENITKLAAIRALRLCCTYKGVNINNAVLSLCKWGLAEVKGRSRGSSKKGFVLSNLAGDFLTETIEDYVRIVLTIYAGILPMERPLEDSLEPLKSCYQFGIKSGDSVNALCAAMTYGYHCLCVGLPLQYTESNMAAFVKEAGFFPLPSIQIQFSFMQKVIVGLRDKKKAVLLLAGETLEKTSLLNKMEGSGREMTDRDIWTFRLMMAYIFRDYETLELMLDNLSKIPISGPMIARTHLRQTYTGLAGFLLHRKTRQKKHYKYACGAFKYFRGFEKNGCSNVNPLYYFLLAEKSPSRVNYDNAIRILSRSGRTNLEAMANESAALLMYDQKDNGSGDLYMSRAVSLYLAWGATAKASLLQEKYSVSKELGMSPCIEITSSNGKEQMFERKDGSMSIFNFKENHSELYRFLGQSNYTVLQLKRREKL